jgi:hypothetical protein
MAGVWLAINRRPRYLFPVNSTDRGGRKGSWLPKYQIVRNGLQRRARICRAFLSHRQAFPANFRCVLPAAIQGWVQVRGTLYFPAGGPVIPTRLNKPVRTRGQAESSGHPAERQRASRGPFRSEGFSSFAPCRHHRRSSCGIASWRCWKRADKRMAPRLIVFRHADHAGASS